MSTRSRGCSRPTSWLMTPLVLLVLCRGSHQIAKNFVNSSTPDLRPTFVVNFDTSTVICQHSSDPTDLHIHNMSSLCDGKQDCFVNPAMHDEVFPYCEHKCESSSCSGRGACLYDGAKPQCYCDSGFSGAACELQDKNECLEHPCHMMAQCQNTLGSYECRCLPGYEGNGHECTDIDECSEKVASRCPEHSKCINLPGTYYCNCTQGFTPKGNQGSGLDKCADINECETGAHNCEANEICENTIGSFKCVTKCSPGYTLIDGKCEDVNECASEKLHKCDVRAECINTVGGYECECEEGFDGDGKNCQPKSSCRKNSAICDRHASCNIFLDICDCKTGYTGDGITCHDVNECDAKDTPCSDGGRCLNLDGGYVCCKNGQDDAACIKDQGAFCSGGCGDNAICSNATCACIDGFRGDPHKKCTDINECEENDSVCGGVGDRCVNLFGGYKCCQHGSTESECTDQAFSSDSSTVSSHGADFTTTGEQIVEGSGSIQTSSGGSITVTRGVVPKEVELTTSGRLACTSYCPPNSECVGGYCECVKGYGGNALVGCEDVDECITETCNQEANEWCVNLIGGFVCCNPTNATHDDCIGLEITKEKGLHVIGPNEEDTVVATRSNHSTSDQLITEVVQQSKNFSSGQIILTRKNVLGGEAVTQTTDSGEELGLEISAKDFGITLPSTLEPKIEGSGKTSGGVWTEEEDGEDDDLMEGEGSGSWSTTINGTGFTGSPRSEGTIRVRITTLGEDGETETATKPGIQVPKEVVEGSGAASGSSGSTSSGSTSSGSSGSTTSSGESGKLAVEKEGHESTSTGQEAGVGKSGTSESGSSGSSGTSESGSSGSSSSGESGASGSATPSSGTPKPDREPENKTPSSESESESGPGHSATPKSDGSTSPSTIVEGSGASTPSESTSSSLPEGSGEWIETGSKGHFEKGNKVVVSNGGSSGGKPDSGDKSGDKPDSGGKPGSGDKTDKSDKPKTPEITTDGEDSSSTSTSGAKPDSGDKPTSSGDKTDKSDKPKTPEITTDGEDSSSTSSGDKKPGQDRQPGKKTDVPNPTDSAILTTSSGGKNATLEHGTKLIEVKPEGKEEPAEKVGLEISAGEKPKDTSNEVGLEIVWEKTTPEPTTPDTDNVGLEISGLDLITTKKPTTIEGSGTGDEEITATTRDVSKSTKKPRVEIDGGDNGETSGVDGKDGKSTTPPTLTSSEAPAPESTTSPTLTSSEAPTPPATSEVTPDSGTGEPGIPDGSGESTAAPEVSPTSSAPAPETPTSSTSTSEVEGSGETSTTTPTPIEGSGESTTTSSESSKPSEATTEAPQSTETTSEPLILTAAPSKAPEVTTATPEATKPSEATTAIPQSSSESSVAPESSTTPSESSESSTAPTAQPATVIPPQNRGDKEKPEPTKETFALPTTTEKPKVANETIENTKCTSSDECGMDALCERRTGVCRCEPGFEGAPPKKACVDVDECATGDHKCHDTARCQNFIGGYACFCPTGFRKTDDGSCEDIDECKEHNSTCCGANAHCVNKPGTYSCECEHGFLGDGYHCVPNTKKPCDHEQSQKSHCSESNMSCEVDTADGAVECKECMSGYKKKGTICEDINECDEQSPCSANAACVNLNGTFSCACKPGFRGDGFMCTDINECDERHPCHPHAECTNTEGSFKCECHAGFEGDGVKKCTNPLERSCEDVEAFCGRVEHVSCLSVRIYNGSLSSVCECEPGFRFDKKSNACVDIDECEENRNNCDPASAVCVNTEGSFKCECAEGYEGEGGVCTDIDECDRGMAGCDSMAMCINRMGSCGCKCMAGYTGDGAHCTKIEEPDTTTTSKTACTEEWSRLCELEKKQCTVDEEEVPQCGACLPGHHPINGTCQSLQISGLCAQKNDCNKHAECIDILPDSHFCSCPDGFIGDGMMCDDVDECNNAGMCDDENSKCENTIGSFNCICLDGFKKSGDKCVVDEKKQPNREKIEVDEENSSSTPSESAKPETTTTQGTVSSTTSSELSSESTTSSESPVKSSESPASSTSSGLSSESPVTSTTTPKPVKVEEKLTSATSSIASSTTSSESPVTSSESSSESTKNPEGVTSSESPVTSSESPSESTKPAIQSRTTVTSSESPSTVSTSPTSSESTTSSSKPETTKNPTVTSSQGTTTSSKSSTPAPEDVTSSEAPVPSSKSPTSSEKPSESTTVPVTSSEAPRMVTVTSSVPSESATSSERPVTSSESSSTVSSTPTSSVSPVTSSELSTSSKSPVTSTTPEVVTSESTVTSSESTTTSESPSIVTSTSSVPSESTTSSESPVTSSEKPTEFTKPPVQSRTTVPTSSVSPVTSSEKPTTSESVTSSDSTTTSSKPVTSSESTTTSPDPITTPAVDEGIATSSENPLEEATTTEDSLTVSVRIHELSTTSSESPSTSSEVVTTPESSTTPEPKESLSESSESSTTTTPEDTTTSEPLILTAGSSKAPESTTTAVAASEATTQPSKTSSASSTTSPEVVTSSESTTTSSESPSTSPTSSESPVKSSESPEPSTSSGLSSESPVTSTTNPKPAKVEEKVTSAAPSTESSTTSSESPVTSSESPSESTKNPEGVTSSESPVASSESPSESTKPSIQSRTTVTSSASPVTSPGVVTSSEPDDDVDVSDKPVTTAPGTSSVPSTSSESIVVTSSESPSTVSTSPTSSESTTKSSSSVTSSQGTSMSPKPSSPAPEDVTSSEASVSSSQSPTFSEKPSESTTVPVTSSEAPHIVTVTSSVHSESTTSSESPSTVSSTSTSSVSPVTSSELTSSSESPVTSTSPEVATTVTSSESPTTSESPETVTSTSSVPSESTTSSESLVTSSEKQSESTKPPVQSRTTVPASSVSPVTSPEKPTTSKSVTSSVPVTSSESPTSSEVPVTSSVSAKTVTASPEVPVTSPESVTSSEKPTTSESVTVTVTSSATSSERPVTSSESTTTPRVRLITGTPDDRVTPSQHRQNVTSSESESSSTSSATSPQPPAPTTKTTTTTSSGGNRGPPSIQPNPDFFTTSSESPTNNGGYGEGVEEETTSSSTSSSTTTTTTTTTGTPSLCSTVTCHSLATCEPSTGVCICRDGFLGDGTTACSKKSTADCISLPSLCADNAKCVNSTRSCECDAGYIGDGYVCSPHPQDCVLRDNLCSPEAICQNRRCQCLPGFTGDGVKCVSIHERANNCTQCDANAHCVGGTTCKCNNGYFGNGLCCVPDPLDCVHFTGICHPNAVCNPESRQCQCSSGFSGNGVSCFPQKSCRTDKSVCAKNAICLPTGSCICRHGFKGDPFYKCTSLVAKDPAHQDLSDVSSCATPCDAASQLCISGECICKPGFRRNSTLSGAETCADIDECAEKTHRCDRVATCRNTFGSHVCTCPDGHVGDGITCVPHVNQGKLSVYCEADGMTLVLGNETSDFEGKIFVKGQAENPYCSKSFSSLLNSHKPYVFKVAFQHCDVQLLDNHTMASTVVVQKHAMFLTNKADSYDLRCQYPIGSRAVESHVNVSELATTSTLTDKNSTLAPICRLSVSNDQHSSISSAMVGDTLKLALEVTPTDNFGILPRNCFAVNIESGERYTLTDEQGCAIDESLFPQWSVASSSKVQAVFRTFKWPDSSMIRFQCDCNPCVGQCTVPTCISSARFRRHQTTSPVINDEVRQELVLMSGVESLAVSSIINVHDASEDSDDVTSSESATSSESSICVKMAPLLIALVSFAVCSAILLYLCSKKPKTMDLDSEIRF